MGTAAWAWVVSAVLFVSVFLVGLVAGILFATQVGQVRVQNRLGARDFTMVKHRFEIAVGGLMPPLVIAAGVSIVLVTIAVAADGPVYIMLALLALALWVAVVVTTLVYNVPVNRLAAAWEPDAPPPDWERLRGRWHRGQTIRTPLALAAFAAVTLLAVLPDTS